MATYVVRVWVPDRPGALGAVASRIGAVRGDLVGVEILERGAGRAIDELVVEFPRPDLLDLMISEVNQVDGVDVEDVREVPGAPVDPRLDALETAAYLVERHDPADLLRALVAHVARDFESDWAAVVDPGAPQPLTSTGALPPEAWVFAFVQGRELRCTARRAPASPAPTTWPGRTCPWPAWWWSWAATAGRSGSGSVASCQLWRASLTTVGWTWSAAAGRRPWARLHWPRPWGTRPVRGRAPVRPARAPCPRLRARAEGGPP